MNRKDILNINIAADHGEQPRPNAVLLLPSIRYNV